jgi:hydroxypyruvate reductase
MVVLLSGGASALMAVPAGAVTLKEKVDTTRVLLGAGVPIHELNCVRKHLSLVKGGRLALATPGRVLTLAISDVVSPVEDDPSVIGSGPTVSDDTTFAEALAIVDRPRIREGIPPSVIRLLERGRDGLVSETMQDGNLSPERAMYRVIGSRREAMAGALLTARKLGYQATAINKAIEGEARVVGVNHPERILSAGRQLTAPRCVVSSGETTVNVSGRGRGGRNQELVLAALSELSRLGSGAVLASVGTDGIDGPTDAAGAMVDSTTGSRASAMGLASPESYLADNDAYAYFDRLGDLIRTGPTGTNVGDLQVVLTK